MIADLIDLILSGDDDAVFELEEEAGDDPVALRPYLLPLLDADHIPETLFRAADEDLQREAVARVDAGAGDFWLVSMLTATRGPVVEAAFRRWLKQPPPGIGVEADDLARLLHGYGWDFDADGQAREICGTTAYRLVPEGGAGPSKERCPSCAGPLWTVLDVDTADPLAAAALTHTGWQGRLRIVTCYLCSVYGKTFAEVTPDGGAVWSAHTVQPGYLKERELEVAEPPLVRLVPGEQRPSLHLANDATGQSTLGGLPGWIQDPDYPACPACGQVMTYVGAVAGSDVAERGVGVNFLFLHTPCGLAGVVSQFD